MVVQDLISVTTKTKLVKRIKCSKLYALTGPLSILIVTNDPITGKVCVRAHNEA